MESNAAMASFATTHWSIVMAAASTTTPVARQAWEQLARVYWVPIYRHVRRRGRTHEDAQDLVQAFFERLISKPVLQHAQRERGRFRTFLLAALNNFLANEHDRATALKRGGGIEFQPLPDLEPGSAMEPAAAAVPAEQLFDREWAQTHLDRALALLTEEFAAAGKSESWQTLRPFLFRSPEPGEYEAAARRHGVSSVLMRKAVSRVRERFRTLVRSEVARTVATVEDVEQEFQHLIDILAAS